MRYVVTGAASALLGTITTISIFPSDTWVLVQFIHRKHSVAEIYWDGVQKASALTKECLKKIEYKLYLVDTTLKDMGTFDRFVRRLLRHERCTCKNDVHSLHDIVW